MLKLTRKNFRTEMARMALDGEIPKFFKALQEGVVIYGTRKQELHYVFGDAKWTKESRGVSLFFKVTVDRDLVIKRVHMRTFNEKYHLVFRMALYSPGADTAMVIVGTSPEIHKDTTFCLNVALTIGL